MQTYAILDAMRATGAAALDGYQLAKSCPNNAPAPAAASAGAAADLQDWLSNLQREVAASACGQIDVGTASGGLRPVTVTVTWTDPKAPAGAPPRQLVTEAWL